jgi:ABC-type glycerol-3-phosphate transport system substrate-binding protein
MPNTTDKKPGVDASRSILQEIGSALEAARKSKKGKGSKGEHTLIEAAAEMHIGSDPNSKANVHNIEKGKIYLPWRRVVAFANYTQRDPATILIALAAAKALEGIEDHNERDKLLTRLKALLGVDSIEALVRRADVFSLERYQTEISRPPFLEFWHKFRSDFPASLHLPPKLAPGAGAYREVTLEQAFGLRKHPWLILQGTPVDALELSLLSYIEKYKQLFIIYLDADALRENSLQEHVNRTIFQPNPNLKHLSLDAPELKNSLLFVAYNLPKDQRRLEHTSHLITNYLVECEKSESAPRFIIFADQHAHSTPPGDRFPHFETFNAVPLSEQEALREFESQLLSAGVRFTHGQIQDWVYQTIRHPFWLGVICRVGQEKKRIPQKWESVGLAASVLAKGGAAPAIGKGGIYPMLIANARGKDTAVLRRIAEAAASSLHEGTPIRSNEITLSPGEFLHAGLRGPLLERKDERAAIFTFYLTRYYFAAVHYLLKITEARSQKRAVEDVAKALARLHARGDRGRVVAIEVASALIAEAHSHDQKIGDALEKALSESGGKGMGLSQRVVHAKKDSAPNTASPPLNTNPRNVDDAEVKTMFLRILVEDQEPGWALRTLAASEKLRFPSGPRGERDDALIVHPILAPYDIVRESIQQIIAPSADKRSVLPDVDIIICPHYSLAWEMAKQGSFVPISPESVPSLTKLGFLGSHYCKMAGQWFGIPFQYPTKYLCYRTDLIENPPTSYDELLAKVEELNHGRDGKPGLGLQGRPMHQSLYYEWLSFALALGGGDVLWDVTSQDGEVILDSPETVEATLKFFELLHHAHAQSRHWDWQTIIKAMAEGQVAMSLPFSDTIPELNRLRQMGDISYAPFRLADGLSAPFIPQKIYGYSGAPVHVFTGHIMVGINSHPDMVKRIHRFMDWFLETETQDQFSVLSYQSPYLDARAIVSGAEPAVAAALSSGAVAQKYAFLPPHNSFPQNEPKAQLPLYQNDILRAISDLVKRGDRPTSEDVRRKLGETAEHLRTYFMPERRQS